MYLCILGGMFGHSNKFSQRIKTKYDVLINSRPGGQCNSNKCAWGFSKWGFSFRR